MSKRICPSCERPMRLGRRALLLEADGVASWRIVCVRCYERAVAVLACAPVTVAPACAHCKTGAAAVCLACVERLGVNVRGLIAANVMLANGKEGGNK